MADERLIYAGFGTGQHIPRDTGPAQGKKLMLREAIQATGIAPATAASLLGINPDLFQEWITEQRPLPTSWAALLSSVVGIDLSQLTSRKVGARDTADIVPAIWYRLRDASLLDTDREIVFLIRQLGYFIHELEEVTGTPLASWRSIFHDIRHDVDKQAPPRQQGRQAAALFRDARGLATGASGIGEVIRGNLRSMGVVVIESPIRDSALEGCCFFVGGQESSRPCVFANSYRTTWFRQNLVIMHEVAHAIFDAETDGATLDFRNSETPALAEERADAFALEMLVPGKVLRHVAQRFGIRWDSLDAVALSRLVAEIHVEKRTILRAAVADGLITQAQVDSSADIDISDELRSLSDHALSAREFISKKYGGQGASWTRKRNTTIPSRRLRLPTLYISKVVGAFQGGLISKGKAAEMLMIDDDTFCDRFGALDKQTDNDYDW